MRMREQRQNEKSHARTQDTDVGAHTDEAETHAHTQSQTHKDHLDEAAEAAAKLGV